MLEEENLNIFLKHLYCRKTKNQKKNFSWFPCLDIRLIIKVKL